MAVQPVRNIAPFINITFTVTSAWWVERWGTIHKGLDISAKKGSKIKTIIAGKVTDIYKDDNHGVSVKVEGKDKLIVI